MTGKILLYASGFRPTALTAFMPNNANAPLDQMFQDQNQDQELKQQVNSPFITPHHYCLCAFQTVIKSDSGFFSISCMMCLVLSDFLMKENATRIYVKIRWALLRLKFFG